LFPLRDENPTRSRPLLTWALIAVNLGIFFGSWLSGKLEEMVLEYGMRPREILAGRELHTLFASMFLHGGILHVVGNVWYLWIFGDNIEDVLGKVRFLGFYLLTGFAASMAHALANPTSQIPTIGASGAVAGVLGAYFVLYPWARVHTALFLFYIIHLVTIPAIALIGFWFVLQVISASITWIVGVPTGIAYLAHIGGFVAGMVLIFLLRRRKRAASFRALNEHYYVV
jgi:membrane associated rhomboid family serine protease